MPAFQFERIPLMEVGFLLLQTCDPPTRLNTYSLLFWTKISPYAIFSLSPFVFEQKESCTFFVQTIHCHSLRLVSIWSYSWQKDIHVINHFGIMIQCWLAQVSRRPIYMVKYPFGAPGHLSIFRPHLLRFLWPISRFYERQHTNRTAHKSTILENAFILIDALF